VFPVHAQETILVASIDKIAEMEITDRSNVYNHLGRSADYCGWRTHPAGPKETGLAVSNRPGSREEEGAGVGKAESANHSSPVAVLGGTPVDEQAFSPEGGKSKA
jgi:hypothetical protein